MRRTCFVISIVFLGTTCFSQARLGVFGGIANYQGDLVDGLYQSPRAAFGVSLSFPVSDRLAIRTGLTFAKVAGADSLDSRTVFKNRNLSFQSPVTELSVLGEYNLFNIDQTNWSPYIFAGAAWFHYNPFTYYSSARKVYLQPLGTEGQGISGYNTKPYALSGLALPFGGGVKFKLGGDIELGIEAGLRKLFTDYLDDVSNHYADAQDLLQARGQLAVDLAFRGDEVPGSTQVYPSKADVRGNPKSKDYYYFTGLHLTFRIGNGEGWFSGGGKRGYGCPNNPL